MEHEREEAVGASAGRASSGFLHEFLSRFAAACNKGRQDGAAPTPAGPFQAADATHETRGLLVGIAGEVLFRCSAHLAQVCGCGCAMSFFFFLPSPEATT